MKDNLDNEDFKGGEFRNRYLFIATLTTTSPLHIGSGSDTTRAGFVRDTGKKKEPVRIPAVVTDANNRPYLPGSTIRGCMRDWLSSRGYPLRPCGNLFGDATETSSRESHNREVLFREGKLEVHDAQCTTNVSTPDSAALCYWSQRRVTYVVRSVAIDPKTGTAYPKRFYSFEVVPEGVSFELKITAQNLDDEELAVILDALKGFNEPDMPLTIGAMDKQWFGHLTCQLEAVYRVDRQTLDKWRKNAKKSPDAGYTSLRKTKFQVREIELKRLAMMSAQLKERLRVPRFHREIWELTLETPLCIRSGDSFFAAEESGSKKRYQSPSSNWMKREKEGVGTHDISDLYHGVRIVAGYAVPFCCVPSSAFRGALRSWTIRHLLNQNQWELDRAKSKQSEDPKYLDPILSLFGEMPQGAISTGLAQTGKGRLYFGVHAFSKNGMTISGVAMNDCNMPNNATRHVKVRNPICRVTDAPKDEGLHHFLEFSRGQSLKLEILISEPKEFDIKLIKNWLDDINSGLLRIGGLSHSIGRGRLSARRIHSNAEV